MSIQPEAQLMNLPTTDLAFGVGDVYSPVATAPQNRIQASVATQDFTPGSFALLPNFPNPFNPTTTIRYQVPEEAKVTLVVYDILGKKVKTVVEAFIPAGHHQMQWDGRNDSGEAVGSGIYLLKMMVKSRKTHFVDTQKLMLMK